GGARSRAQGGRPARAAPPPSPATSFKQPERPHLALLNVPLRAPAAPAQPVSGGGSEGGRSPPPRQLDDFVFAGEDFSKAAQGRRREGLVHLVDALVDL